MKKLLNTKEAANLLRCSEKTVRRLIVERELEALHVRGGLRVTLASVDFYVKRRILKFSEENGPYRFVGSEMDTDGQDSSNFSRSVDID